ncbi:sulfatase family protein [Puniceicoccus vermicola]|uniref:Sulfatase-like hydrolase/transferase n=1 Tax=Puniceicoccus vermicola TaxID=388746 RepID=A0A7X1B096_9BACT|nr:sulfatase-like hydrolase/transferase [Puniceicoccus vermicola]MBC2603250.1 sulfatase-like hydrolase/transferase [Puniceicoccus vermicola]
MRERNPRNVLLICVDQMRAEHLGCVGHPNVRTPNLDRLAARGIRFSNSYCNNPICMPARTTMFTGLMQRDHGVRINGQQAHPGLHYLPQIFKDAGYRTHAAGKLHLTPYVPKLDQPDPQRFPEDLEAWNRGNFSEFTTPYFGFDTVDFVGGHTSFVFGEYIHWLKSKGGDPEMLKPNNARKPACAAANCYRMALPAELHYNRYITDSTIRHIDSCAAENASFFTFCSIPDPHFPVAPPAPYDTLYNPDDVKLPPPSETERLPPIYQQVHEGKIHPSGTDNSGLTEAKRREMLALTFGMITHLDTEIGRVLDTLDRHGLWENTVVAFVSDHGDMMGDQGLLWKAFYTFDGCIRIPTIVAAPETPGGLVSDSLICQMDLLPTLLDFADLPLPGSEWREKPTPFERGSVQPLNLLGGRSWRSLLSDPEKTIRDSVVIENDEPSTGLRPRCLVTPEFRLTVYAGQSWGEMFDRVKDPFERRNLWDDPKFQSTKAALLQKLMDAYTQETPWLPIPPWNS